MGRLMRWLRLATAHHRLTLFWVLSTLGLIAPWITSCESPTLTKLFRQEQPCSVQSIHDGDTLRLTCAGEHLQVRLYCIDAPELEQQPWGQESRNHLQAITPKRVLLIPHDKDRYGRTVGEVLSDDPDRENLNLAQVRSGNAAVYRGFCEGNAYYQAEREGQAAQDRDLGAGRGAAGAVGASAAGLAHIDHQPSDHGLKRPAERIGRLRSAKSEAVGML